MINTSFNNTPKRASVSSGMSRTFNGPTIGAANYRSPLPTIGQSVAIESGSKMTLGLYLPHLKPKNLGSVSHRSGTNNLTMGALGHNRSISQSSNGSIKQIFSPKIKSSSSLLKPVLATAESRRSTAPSEPRFKMPKALNHSGFQKYEYRVSINDVVVSGDKKDQTFVLPGYYDKLPAPFTVKDKPTVLGMNKDEGKRDFISHYLYQHRNDPGPKYNVELDMSKKSPVYVNTKSFKIQKDQIPNFIDSVQKVSASKPGPGRYDPEKKTKRVIGNYTYSAHKSQMYEESVWLGMQSPSHYDTVDISKHKMARTQDFKIRKPFNPEPQNIVKNNLPSPASYKFEGIFPRQSHHLKAIQWSVPRAQGRGHIEQAIKMAKKTPGVGAYHIQKADKVITLGARQGYK